MALVAYRSWGRIRNIGDDLMPYITSSLFGNQAVRVSDMQPHILGIGSILSIANANSFIWGSGLLNNHASFSGVRTDRLRAVRGEKTRDALSRAGYIKNDLVLGDPGIFAREVAINYNFRIKPKAKRIVVFPHHHSVDHPFFMALRGSEEIEVVEPFDNSLAVLEAIFNSDVVVSQSLHGLVFAEAFKKPVTWITSEHHDHWNFKFEDWFSTTDNPHIRPLSFDGSSTAQDLQSLISAASRTQSQIDKTQLRAAFPDDPEILSAGEVFDVRTLRRLIPFKATISSDFKPSGLFSDVSETDLDILSSQTRAALANVFQACPERGYCLIMTSDLRWTLTERQRSAVCRIMDRDVTSDYVTLLHSREVPVDLAKTEFSDGVYLTDDTQILGSAFCVRSDFESFNCNFRTLIVDSFDD